MPRRKVIAMAAGGLVISFGVLPIGQLHAQGKTDDVKADSRFINEAVEDNLLEVRLGERAEKKAGDPAVKQFGERMVTDHTAMQNEWTALASKNGMTVKPALGPRHERKLDRLEKVSGKKFDREYMSLMVQSHQDEVGYVQGEGKSAHSAPVRDLAAKDLPTLQQHLATAKEVGAKVGADTAATRTRHVAAKKKK